VLVVIILKQFNLPLLTTSFAALSVFTLWEIVEPPFWRKILGRKFKESSINQIRDIFYGFLGFFVYSWIF